MRMTYGNRQGVRGIGTDPAREPQQYRNHVSHLRFLRRTRANQRHLDRPWRVFKQRDTLRHRTQGRSARLPQLERTFHVPVDEHTLDSDFLRLVLVDETLQAVKY